MNGRTAAIAVVLSVVVLGGLAAGFLVLGGGPGGDGGGLTGDGAGGGGGSGGDDAGAATATPAMEDTNASFQFTIDEIEECGNTCRDVTATIVNDGGETAEGIVVHTTMYADDDVVWEGTEEIGELPANESYTSTREVDVGYGGGAKIQENDGYVTIETVIEFDDGQEVFTERRQVA
ncbi:hypothetical protein [Haloparvum sedimenti]|uniref:hypothetical protein n=1 Tax=Haloparvum sedimenti TaxID=1678448 RepID=UPI00071E8A2A|nr:hypothetical protein [Haloparvum sedimenti]